MTNPDEEEEEMMENQLIRCEFCTPLVAAVEYIQHMKQLHPGCAGMYLPQFPSPPQCLSHMGTKSKLRVLWLPWPVYYGKHTASYKLHHSSSFIR